MQSEIHPEAYYVPKGIYVPNNPIPILVYRNVLPRPLDRNSAQALCEANNWEKRGEWGPFFDAHFHPNTHECYAIFQGHSTLALGREGDEAAQGGVEVEVKAGDVIVVPAGVSHRSLSAENYRYIGVYPKDAPKWRNNWCEGAEKMDDLVEEIQRVGVPDHDPVYGLNGPLVTLWRQASRPSKM